ncbi:MAG: glycosyltransferase, partial [Armatimonadota bacterium]
WDGLCGGEGGVDDNAGYSQQTEEAIISSADVVTASARTLAEHLKGRFGLQDRPVVVPNSLDPSFLMRPVRGRPPELPDRGPIVGYVGSIWGNWQDWETLLAVARSRPSWQIVLVGGEPEECAYRGRAAAAFTRQPNVQFIPEVPQTRIHRYIDAFDVSIIPFKPGGISRFVHPLKIYDYLARACPVVSCPLPEIEGYPYVRFAEEPSEWLGALAEAMSEPIDPDVVFDFLRHRTWSRAVDRLLSAAGLEQLVGPEGRHL